MGTTNDAPAMYEQGGRTYAIGMERIEFLDKRFYWDREASVFAPSVTTVLEAYPKGWGYIEWLKRNGQDSDEIRDAAGRRGSTVHALTERYDMGEVISIMDGGTTPRYNMDEWAMFERYVEFCESHPHHLHAIEMRMVDAGLGYGGTLDRVLTLESDNITRIVDIKTSGGIWPNYWLQQAAYWRLLTATGAARHILGDHGEIRLSILWLNAKTRGPVKGKVQGKGWQMIDQPESTAHYLDLFDKTHALWLAENKNAMPRQVSYQIQHQRKVGALGAEQQVTHNNTNDDDDER